MVRKTLSAAVVIAVLLGGHWPAWGQDKPLGVIAFRGLQAVLDDADYIARLAEKPDLAQNLKMGAGMFTEGIDPAKPWGVTIDISPIGTPMVAGFVPVTDGDKVLATLAGVLGEIKDVGDGVKQVTVPVILMQVPMFLEVKDGWLRFAQTAGGLEQIPDDPTEMLGGLHETFTVAIQANLQSLPEPMRQQVMALIEDGFNQAGPRGEMEGDAQFEIRRQMQKKQLENFKLALEQMDQFTIGLDLDDEAKHARMEMSVTVLPDTEAADMMAQFTKAKSKFSGVHEGDRIVRATVTTRYTERDIEQMVALAEQFRKFLNDEIESSDEFPDEDTKNFVRGMMDELMDVMLATVEEGVVDVGFALMGSKLPTDFVAGGRIAEGETLAKVFERLVKVVEAEEEGFQFRLDVGKHGDVRFHEITVDEELPDEIKGFLGDDVKFTVGIGPKSIYLAVGSQGVESLKTLIDSSASGAERELLPVQIIAQLKPIMDYVAQQEDQAEAFAKVLDADNDQVSIVLHPIESGVRYRYDLQEGVLKMIAAGAFPRGVVEPEVIEGEAPF